MTIADSAQASSFRGRLLFIFLGLLTIANSSFLIAFNKFLLSQDRFPFPLVLMMIHTILSSVLSSLLYLLVPSLFPALSDPDKKVCIGRNFILTGALPIAFLFCGQLALGSSAVKYLTVSFVQMMKEANTSLVCVLSIAFAVEKFRWQTARILLIIPFATALTVHGESQFHLLGFMLQGTSQIFECTRIVLQAAILTDAGKKLDTLTYLLIVMPLCFLTLTATIGGLAYFNPSSPNFVPSREALDAWWPLLLVNGLVAFSLNVVSTLCLQQSSAIAVCFIGVFKDIVLVAAGGGINHEALSHVQVLGFSLQLLAISMYTMVKTWPDIFNAGFLEGLCWVVTGTEAPCMSKEALGLQAAKPIHKEYGATERTTAPEDAHEKSRA